jgi:hypothetical protein
MNRMIRSLMAAGAAVLALASPAQAHPEDVRSDYRTEYRYQRASARAWRELELARRRFFARWDGNPWERARFERWYAHRCEELRYRGW